MMRSLGSNTAFYVLLVICVIQCTQSKPMGEDGNPQGQDLSSVSKSKQTERDEIPSSNEAALLDPHSPLEHLPYALPTSGNIFSSHGFKETDQNSKESWSDVNMPEITLNKNENLGQSSSQASNQDTVEKSISNVNQKLVSLTDAVPQMKSFHKVTDEGLENTGQQQQQKSQLLPGQFGHIDQNYKDQGQQPQISPEQRSQFGQIQQSQYDLGKQNPFGQKQQSQNIIDQQNYLGQTQQLQRIEQQNQLGQDQQSQFSLSPQKQLVQDPQSQYGMGQLSQHGFGKQNPFEQGQIQNSIGQQNYSNQAQQLQYSLGQQISFGQKQLPQYSIDQLKLTQRSQHSLDQQNQFGQDQQLQDGVEQQNLLGHVQQSQYDLEQKNQFSKQLPDNDFEQPMVNEKDGQYQYNTGKPRSSEMVELQMSENQDTSNSRQGPLDQMKSDLQTSTLDPSYLDSRLADAYEEEEEEREMEDEEEEDEKELNPEERALYEEDKDTVDKPSLYEGSYEGKLHENSESEYYSDPTESTHVTTGGLVNDEQDKENESDDWYDDPNSYDEDEKLYGNKNAEDDADEGDNTIDVAKIDDYYKTDGEYQGEGDVFEEDVVDSDMVKKDKQPTAPSSMVLFYTWMIVAILIMVVSVSTYQTRCKGIRSQIPKLTHSDDRKRLLDHEYA